MSVTNPFKQGPMSKDEAINIAENINSEDMKLLLQKHLITTISITFLLIYLKAEKYPNHPARIKTKCGVN